ncbi:MAG: holo-ACP synthase [Actinomycetes bacterium]
MTNLAGLGIDLLEIDRLEIALDRRPGLAGRLFTEAELEWCSRRKRPARHLAGRFCAKEASIKAMGLRSATIKEFEVVGGGSQRPEIRLHGRAREIAELAEVELIVSITHGREIAAATATLRSRR